jgi:hypothetical protein
MGGFGGFGGGGFGPPPFNPMMYGGFPGMYGGFPGMGGGFFGGFRPRLRRRRRQRPDFSRFSKQFETLESKIRELQEQLAARQGATPMPDPVMDVPEPRVGTLGGPGFGEFPLGTAGPRSIPTSIGNMGPGRIQIPNIDVEAIKQRIADMNIGMGRPVKSLPTQDVGGRKKLRKPPSISRLPNDMLDAVDDRGVPIFGGRGDLMPPPTKLPRVPARLEPIKMQPLPLPGGERIDLPRIPDEILRDVQSRGTVGPGMVPPPVDKLPRMDPIKVPIKMPPVPMIPAPMPDPMPMPAPMPRMPEPMPMPARNMPMVGFSGPAGRIR